VRVCARVEPSSKPGRSGVYAGQSLSFGLSGKARWGKAKVANRTREIRPSGMKAGARGNVAHGGTVNPPRNRKGGDGNPPPKSARAPVLSRPFHWGKSLAGKWVVRVRTAKDRFRRGLQRIAEWCARHRHAPLRVQQQGINAQLRGHYGYFGRYGNAGRLWTFLRRVVRVWKLALARRSQRGLTWSRMHQLLKLFPLLTPRVSPIPSQLKLFGEWPSMGGSPQSRATAMTGR
jgi:hypothetical protein